MKLLLVLVVVILAVSAQKRKSKKAFLSIHNSLRAKHVDTPALKWDKKLAAYAQKWCEKLQGLGNLVHGESGYGENLYWNSQSSGNFETDAVNHWYSEIADYKPEDENHDYMKSGHFTQVVWKGSKKVGCGVSQGDGGTYICCNYNPPGNIQPPEDYYPDNVLPVKA